MSPILPPGMTEKIPKIELEYERYMFVRPWVLNPTDDDRRTFLLPESKAVVTYEP